MQRCPSEVDNHCIPSGLGASSMAFVCPSVCFILLFREVVYISAVLEVKLRSTFPKTFLCLSLCLPCVFVIIALPSCRLISVRLDGFWQDLLHVNFKEHNCSSCITIRPLQQYLHSFILYKFWEVSVLNNIDSELMTSCSLVGCYINCCRFHI